MILGTVAAIIQKNIKRLLAYSAIGHMGYALAGWLRVQSQDMKVLLFILVFM